jgi:hypothetical protein
VFYDHGGEKSNWGMHEFTVPVDKRLRPSSLPTKASYKYIRVGNPLSLFSHAKII